MARVIKTELVFEGEKYEQYVVVERDDPPQWPDSSQLSVVGTPQTRLDGPERVTGRAEYTYDVSLPGMLACKVLRSPYPHARIIRLDVSKANQLPGVRAVLTHLNTSDIPWAGEPGKLFEQELRYEGAEVVAIAADDELTASDALELIEVEYEQLPFVTDVEQALKQDAPKVSPDGNVKNGAPSTSERGDVGRGFEDADVVVERTYKTSAQLHQCLETHGSVATWEGDSLTVWDSTQYIFGVRNSLAEVFNLPQNKVRVIKKYMGGGFGSKGSLGKYTVIAALLSRRTRRPVKLMLDRREENLSTGYRNETIQHVKLGAKSDGTLTAISVRAYAGVGAYGGGGPVTGPAKEYYACPNVHTEQWSVLTNLGPAEAFRAPGYVEGTFALESAMDELAEKLNMDPIDLRMKNYVERDQDSDQTFTLKELDKSYQKGAEAIAWADGRATHNGRGSIRHGVGMATQVWSGGGGPPAHAIVKVNPDGSATVVSGTQDIGTGTKTMLAQIAAEELGMPLSTFNVELGDTQDMPYAPLSAGSMTTPSVGPAVRMAAEEARKQLLDIAGSMMEVSPDDLDIQNGEVFTPALPENRKSVKEIMAAVDNYMIVGKGSRGPNPDDQSLRTFGTQFAEVEVDTDTGQVRVLKIVAVHESGRVINPLAFGSQIEGGVIQGVGFGVTEQRFVDHASGRVLNANLEDYKLPTAADVPAIEHFALEQVDTQANSIGAKGIGEPPIIPTAAAIANAVSNAIGVRVTALPITPSSILNALTRRENDRA